MKRTCYKCKIEKPLTTEYFHSGGKNKFHRYCRDCRTKTRKDSYKYMTKEQQSKNTARTSYYQKNTISGRAIVMLKGYKRTDAKKGRVFNLTKQWLIENIIDFPCFYCGDNYRTGADRLDNKKGHTIDNCVPCCAVCNSVRSDIFSVLEMKEIGLKIKELRQFREIRKISGHSKE